MPPVKLHGFRLGKRERVVLRLMLKGDTPRGTPIPIWLDICQEVDIEYGFLQKKFQRAEFCNENMYKCALSRLVRKGLIKPIIEGRQDCSLLDPKVHGYNYYCLTELGRLVAEELQQPDPKMVLFLKEFGVLQNVLVQLVGFGAVEVTVDQIREELWLLIGHTFSSGVEFDRYWNNTKLGLLLKRCVVGQVRVGVIVRQRKYFLSEP